nr:hypothetical protein [Brevibacillus laterosporus]
MRIVLAELYVFVSPNSSFLFFAENDGHEWKPFDDYTLSNETIQGKRILFNMLESEPLLRNKTYYWRMAGVDGTTGNKAVLIAGVLGAMKLLADSYGYSIITDDQINAIVNGIFAVVATFTNNFKSTN